MESTYNVPQYIQRQILTFREIQTQFSQKRHTYKPHSIFLYVSREIHFHCDFQFIYIFFSFFAYLCSSNIRRDIYAMTRQVGKLLEDVDNPFLHQDVIVLFYVMCIRYRDSCLWKMCLQFINFVVQFLFLCLAVSRLSLYRIRKLTQTHTQKTSVLVDVH